VLAEGVGFEPTRSKLLAVFKREASACQTASCSERPSCSARLPPLVTALVAVSRSRQDFIRARQEPPRFGRSAVPAV
jgi:hypothetical protein